MSHFEGLASNVVGILLVGAEGCAETQHEQWLRDADAEETALFKEYCKELVRERKGEQDAKQFDFSEFTVDGTGRPYWLKAVLDDASTPAIARDKAQRYTRSLRVHEA